MPKKTQTVEMFASRRDIRWLLSGEQPRGAALLLQSDETRGPLSARELPTVRVRVEVDVYAVEPTFASKVAEEAFDEAGLDAEALLVTEPSGKTGYTKADVDALKA